MHKRRRKGNILLVVILLVVTTTAFATLLKVSVAQRNDAWHKINDVGTPNTYVAMANICADAFRTDLEAMYWLLTVADIDNLYGVSNADYGIEIYDTAIQKFQAAMQRDVLGDGRWVYHLTDPYMALEYAGVSDTETMRYLANQLDGAKVELIVQNDIELMQSDDDAANLEEEDTLTVSDIIFQVHFTKGTWKVEQEYRLTGLKMLGKFGDAQVKFSIDGSKAECRLEHQMVTRLNT